MRPSALLNASLLTMSCAQMQARGIYATLPQPRNTPPTPVSGGHLDGHPFQLGVEAYIDDVEEGGGSLHLWPQSHRRVFAHFKRQHSNDPVDVTPGGANGVQPNALVARIAEDTAPVETCGPAGTVVFWHHRGMRNIAILSRFAALSVSLTLKASLLQTPRPRTFESEYAWLCCTSSRGRTSTTARPRRTCGATGRRRFAGSPRSTA